VNVLDLGPILGALLIVLIVVVLIYLSVRIVNEYDRLVVFRFGRTGPLLVKGPGIVLLIPIVDRPVRIDLREQFIEVPSQTTITKDNAPINVDFLIYWRIVDPMKSIVNVANFAGALQGVATTTLRAVIGDILLDEVLSRREQINEILRTKLDDVTERWGGKVTTVEIREITPPRDVQDAMNRQLSAERTRRAVITESEGRRQSEINVAEGAKQATILAAEGDRQSRILRAEGERQSLILNAEGYGQALERIFASASLVDQKTMAIQYLETLKALGASPSTKYILPLELSRLVESVSGMVDEGMHGRGDRPRVGPPGEQPTA
jgi:regulator of protease activity HflC (stomatin/prohibitin superfamily)